MPRPTPILEALALFEFSSIGRGARVVDDITKKAPIEIHTARPVSSGKYLLIFMGAVGPVEESFKEGLAVGGAAVVNKLFLPQVHDDVIAALREKLEIDPKEVDALAIVESTSMSTTVGAADAAAKAAEVRIMEIRLGQGIGGKGFFTLTGSHADVQAAVSAAVEVAEREKTLLAVEIIPRPSPEAIRTFTGES